MFPNPRALAVAQDRLAEKTLFRELGIARAGVRARSTRARSSTPRSPRSARPCILKTRRLGYDGKGQFRLQHAADADAAWDALGAQARRSA